MKLQNLTVIFIIIIIPIILLTSFYISTGLRTIKYQTLYDTGLLTATHDAIYAFELNTANHEFAGNPEVKRDILKSSIKMFEKSLCNTCNISSYNTSEIEKYIPAIVFGMHDGFYMYAPSYNAGTNKYAHSLKNYVYYSETLDDGTVIIYSLDNYVTVSGVFNGKYEVHEGYLIDPVKWDESNKEYNGTQIVEETINGATNDEGIKYYKEAYEFSDWFLNTAKIQDKDKDGVKANYLNIDISSNDPENENSPFVQHKRTVIKNKIEGVLNSSITAYSDRTWGTVYKMPKLSEEDWQKIYSNISMITFFQGKSIGLTKYNGYYVLNSTNSKEYVNPNLMYFISSDGDSATQDYYHDIRCSKCSGTLTGYKIGSYEKRKVEEEVEVTNQDGTTTTTTETRYEYDHDELACYNCVNGTLSTQSTVFDYVTKSGTGYATDNIKTAYWTSLGRERYNQVKLLRVKKEERPITGPWTDNGDGTFTRGNVTVEIGDYVEYVYDSASEYTVEAKHSGYSDRTYTQTSNLKWRVMGVDETGRLELISKNPTSASIFLKGSEGYNKGVYILNHICKSQYSNSTLGITARSLAIEDIEERYSNAGNQEKDIYRSQNTGLAIGSTKLYEGSKKYYPNLYKEVHNDPTKRSNLFYSEDTFSTSNDTWKKETNYYLNVRQSYYHIYPNKEKYLDNQIFYQMIFSNSNTYWLASRYADCGSTAASFGMYKVYYGRLQPVELFLSSNSTRQGNVPLRVVVTLPDDIIVTTNANLNSESNMWQLSK